MQTFLELQCLVDDLVVFLELSMCQCFIILNILFDEVDKGPKHEKKFFGLESKHCINNT